ncbi:hypothetical protein V8C34DRAFT_284422 [Trichoderma compactum]
MAVQVLDALNIKKAFALGTSQGGWIVTRMALVSPEKVWKSSLCHGNCRTYMNKDANHLYGKNPSLSCIPVIILTYCTASNPHVSFTFA